jgi:hypothetical protein
MSLAAVVLVGSGSGSRPLQLGDYLDAAAEEAAADDAYAWIKGLREARVGGEALRQRFTYRGDSLWWFAELYLHKERAILTLCRAIRATETLIARERPHTISVTSENRAVCTAVSAAASTHRIQSAARESRGSLRRLGAMDARSTALAVAAMASPSRPRARVQRDSAIVTAFVHRAFWKTSKDEGGSAESYIGPVLQSLETRLPGGAVQYIGIGPSTNFRARRWWRASRGAGRHVIPIERLTPRTAMQGSWNVWKSRHVVRRELRASDDIRQRAVIRGCDCWPVVRDALDGIALLQFPWSARAMDEAAAALETLRPRVAVTYAEAGGWGRALALEARRKGIPLAGLQHGFIYRHWLNYRHEPDEMVAPSDGSSDRGFPRPTLTLVFDEYAARHLTDAARFPREAIAVTGSPRLDALVAEAASLTADTIERARQDAGASGGEPLVAIVSKYTEIRSQLPALFAALRELSGIRAAIKTHPAETSAPYEAAAAGIPNVRVLPASYPLAPLLRAAQLIVTVNSTVAIDGLVLGIPALTIGLPNNLTPFVDAGAMAGTAASDDIGPAIRRLLYDRGFRQQLDTVAADLITRYRLAADGGAAERAASAILDLADSQAT